MINSLDDLPDYVKGEVQKRIAAGGKESTLIVDETEEEILLRYTGFTDALKREYDNACAEHNEDSIKVYHINKEPSGIQVVKYRSSKGRNAEKMWRESA